MSANTANELPFCRLVSYSMMMMVSTCRRLVNENENSLIWLMLIVMKIRRWKLLRYAISSTHTHTTEFHWFDKFICIALTVNVQLLSWFYLVGSGGTEGAGYYLLFRHHSDKVNVFAPSRNQWLRPGQVQSICVILIQFITLSFFFIWCVDSNQTYPWIMPF